ncbi:hypothetical protein FHX37_2665 [Haloactinospora alba]|uniref:Uncharacterized protein n=1 Tax=Haloactinospora alba TaxID=405555 RepID=A0A543NLL0_9ACTN|nr:hypothetical protein FHX37_2665 [Haloactinospora alba]
MASVLGLKFVVDIGRGSQGSPRRSCARRTGGSGCRLLDPVAHVLFQCSHAFAHAAAGELGGEEGEPALDLVDPGGAGRGDVHMEAGVADQSLLGISGVLCAASLSQARWMSNPSGTALSMLVRKLVNAAARWRRCSSPRTVPPAMLNAATPPRAGGAPGWWRRGGRSRDWPVRACPASSAVPAGNGPEPASDSSRPRTAPPPARAGCDTARPPRPPSPQTAGRWRSRSPQRGAASGRSAARSARSWTGSTRCAAPSRPATSGWHRAGSAPGSAPPPAGPGRAGSRAVGPAGTRSFPQCRIVKDLGVYASGAVVDPPRKNVGNEAL